MLKYSLFLLALPLAAQFRAAAVKVDITPKTPQWLMGYGPRQSTAVHDPIFHRVAVVDDGETRVFLISSDLCVFSPSVYDEFAAEAGRALGIDRKHIWWMTTHTHSAPEVGPPGLYDILLKGRSDHEWSRDYLALVKTTLLAAMREAAGKLEPAVVTIGTGTARANINRRARDLDGTISLGLNPDGPADRQIGIIRLTRPDGGPIALLANYAMHGTVLGGRWNEISGDGPGIVASYVESKFGAPVLYINGAAGNLAPIYTTQLDPKAAHLGEFRVILGDHILAAVGALGAGSGAGKMWLGETWIESPRKEGLGWPPEMSLYTTKDGSVRIPVRFLRVGDAVFWAAPVELFCEIAMRVRNESPFKNTFYFGYTNGWLGYLPTARGFAEGGYEPRTSVLTPRAEADFGDGVLHFLEGIPRSR